MYATSDDTFEWRGVQRAGRVTEKHLTHEYRGEMMRLAENFILIINQFTRAIVLPHSGTGGLTSFFPDLAVAFKQR